MQVSRNKSQQNDSPLVGAIAIGLLVVATAVSAAAQASPWFAGQLGQLMGVSPSTVAGEGGCCGGGCPLGE